jgi:hypothetical protein
MRQTVYIYAVLLEFVIYPEWGILGNFPQGIVREFRISPSGD